ncbi:relaxase/mobilization nuclease domain-containing protein [Nodosilinea sp. LEGE 07298]|uniref:relaxase/mobilization nuclease domain-containing protein n=1 Tax=Nodosilinea sp. LEGE 07298 TaxID=2777970 RepID=UPI00187FCA0B|nr:relaxase/mobilization nuclease domain-containing protein [Nodosilinea sp. LEGE 07298]MBE9108391.1 relaxase/mobilization nuclease domain-containing protein [Nodosilinea sp. LEGE 07298]
MNINYSKGSNPYGLTSYVLSPEKQEQAQAEPILATNMVGLNAEELAEEFRFVHDYNPRVKKTMVHYSVSLSPQEHKSPEEISAISNAVLERTGHQNCQYFVVEHHDRQARHQVQHWHIVTSAVDMGARWVNDAFIKIRLKHLERELEEAFDLEQTKVRAKPDRYNLTTGEYRLKERTGGELTKEKLWRSLQQHTADQPSMLMLVTRLKAEDISVRLYARDGQIDGISYGLDGMAFPGYKLGAAYSFKGLQRHLGVDHAPEQDELLRRVNLLTAQQCRQLLRQSQDHGPVLPQAQESSMGQLDLARYILPIAMQIFALNHQAGATQEVTPGGWRLSGKRYASDYNLMSHEFSLKSLGARPLKIDGQLEADSIRITAASGIQERDLLAFQDMQRILAAVAPIHLHETMRLRAGQTALTP